MAGPLVNTNTGVTSKPMYAGPAALANRPTYSENDPRLQVRQTDPNGLLGRMNPNDLMALRLMSSSSDPGQVLSQLGQSLQGQGYSQGDINQIINMGAGNSGQAAMAGDWRQQLQQHYGANATPTDVFAGTNYANLFQPSQAAQNLQSNVTNGVGAKSAAAGGGTNPITGAPNPTNGVWNVNTFYGQQGTGTNNVPANSNGQVWNPTNAFQPTASSAPPTPAASTGGLTHQLNTPSAPTTPMPTGAMPPFRSTPAPGPVSGNHNGGGGYSFVAPGWNGGGVNWRSGTGMRNL